jgi:Flp pilus assembly pilin Flp
MAQRLPIFWLEEEGQDLIEYALLLAFIAVTCLTFIFSGTTYVNGIWSKGSTTLVSANSAAGS